MNREDLDIIVEMPFGSQLYGTDTPESDTDIKGIFLPSRRDIILQRVSKDINLSTGDDRSKNTSEDVDHGMYSLHYFIKLACEGHTGALDMLHCPDDMLMSSSPIWEFLREHRAKFYTKNLKSYVGYCKNQAAKYGVKGSRLDAAKKVMDFLNDIDLRTNNVLSLGQVWDQLPEGEHIHKLEELDKNGRRQYQVCGKKMQDSIKIPYAYDMIEIFYNKYGARAKLAAENKGIDWKAVSHALRAGYQLKEIYITGDIHYPLAVRDFLKHVKAGKLDYMTIVAPKLEYIVGEIGQLAEDSNYPEKVNHKYWDDYIVKVYEGIL